MQNHTPYQDKYTAIPSAAETGIVSQSIRNYLQDLQYSDQALAELLATLQEWDEPTIVVFGGSLAKRFRRGTLRAEYTSKYA